MFIFWVSFPLEVSALRFAGPSLSYSSQPGLQAEGTRVSGFGRSEGTLGRVGAFCATSAVVTASSSPLVSSSSAIKKNVTTHYSKNIASFKTSISPLFTVPCLVVTYFSALFNSLWTLCSNDGSKRSGTSLSSRSATEKQMQGNLQGRVQGTTSVQLIFRILTLFRPHAHLWGHATPPLASVESRASHFGDDGRDILFRDEATFLGWQHQDGTHTFFIVIHWTNTQMNSFRTICKV